MSSSCTVNYSFVMVAYNKWDMTYQSLHSLVQSLALVDANHTVQVIVVDNGSTDATQEQLDRFARDVHEQTDAHVCIEPLHLDQNLGYPAGVNAGLARAQGRVIAVLNNDLIFPRDWFGSLATMVENNQDIGFAAPVLSSGSGAQSVDIPMPSAEELDAVWLHYVEKNKDKRWDTNKVLGACMVFRRDVLTKIGGNDVWFGVGEYDDDDWCLRARIAGFKIVIVGRSFIFHVGNATFRESSGRVRNSVFMNAHKFERKWNLCEKTKIGMYSRQDVERETVFSRESHFFPISVTEFDRNCKADWNSQGQFHRLLYVADWMDSLSGWYEQLKALLSQVNLGTNVHGADYTQLFIPIPQAYFHVDHIRRRLMRLATLNQNFDFVILDEIHPLQFGSLIQSVNAVVCIEDDFVNRVFCHWAKQLGVSIVNEFSSSS